VRDAAAVTVGRDHDHVADRAQRLREHGDARAFNPVVVGNENAQLRLPSA